MVALVCALVAAGFGRGDDSKRVPSGPVSRVASKASANDLRKVANDPEAKRADRAAAIVALFANHLAPPARPGGSKVPPTSAIRGTGRVLGATADRGVV